MQSYFVTSNSGQWVYAIGGLNVTISISCGASLINCLIAMQGSFTLNDTLRTVAQASGFANIEPTPLSSSRRLRYPNAIHVEQQTCAIAFGKPTKSAILRRQSWPKSVTAREHILESDKQEYFDGLN